MKCYGIFATSVCITMSLPYTRHAHFQETSASFMSLNKIPKKGTAMALAVAFNTMLSHRIKNISVQFRLTFLCGFSLHITQFNRSNLTQSWLSFSSTDSDAFSHFIHERGKVARERALGFTQSETQYFFLKNQHNITHLDVLEEKASCCRKKINSLRDIY